MDIHYGEGVSQVWKWIITIVIILVLVGGGSYFFVHRGKAQNSSAYTPTATVQKGKLESTVSGSGQLSPATDEDVKVTASHTVYSIQVSVNDVVKKGQHLLEFNNGTYLDAPAAGTVTSISVYANQRISPGQAVAHITNYKKLNTVVQVDELDLPSVKVNQPVNIKVNAYPNQTYTGKVKKIAKTGTVSNGVSTFDVTVGLTKSNQAKNLKPGMTDTTTIITDKKENTLYVPVEAVHQSGGQSYVLVVQNQGSNGQNGSKNKSQTSSRNSNQYQRKSNSGGNRSNYQGRGFRGQRAGLAGGNLNATRVTVKTGIHNDSDVEILSGLKEGMTVELPPIVQSSNSSQGNQKMSPAMFGRFGGGGFSGGGRFKRTNSGGGGSSSRGN